MNTITVVVVFQLTPATGIYVEPEGLLNEVVKVKSGEYNNLLMGVITKIVENDNVK